MVLHGIEDEACRISGSEAVHQPVLDGFDGPGADLHFLGDLSGRVFHAKELDDLLFLVGYLDLTGEGGYRFQFGMRPFEEDPVHERGQVEALGFGFDDGFSDIGGVGAFEDIPMGAMFHEVADEAFVFVHGDDDDANVRVVPADPFGGFDAVLVGHLQVHQNDLRPVAGEVPDQFIAIVGFLDEEDIGVGPQGEDDSFPEDLVVIGNGHPNRAHGWFF